MKKNHIITRKKNIKKNNKRRTCAKSGSLVDIKWNNPFLSLHFLLPSVPTLSLFFLLLTTLHISQHKRISLFKLLTLFHPFYLLSPFLCSQIHCFFSQFPQLLPNTLFSHVRTFLSCSSDYFP